MAESLVGLFVWIGGAETRGGEARGGPGGVQRPSRVERGGRQWTTGLSSSQSSLASFLVAMEAIKRLTLVEMVKNEKKRHTRPSKRQQGRRWDGGNREDGAV